MTRGSDEHTHRALWLGLSYGWVFGCCLLLPVAVLRIETEDEFAKWHARHGLVVAVVWALITVLLLGFGNFLGLFWLGGQNFVYLIWGAFHMYALWLCVTAWRRAQQEERWSPEYLKPILEKLRL